MANNRITSFFEQIAEICLNRPFTSKEEVFSMRENSNTPNEVRAQRGRAPQFRRTRSGEVQKPERCKLVLIRYSKKVPAYN